MTPAEYEELAGNLPTGTNVTVAAQDVAPLIATGYRASSGLGPGAHWRKTDALGGCLHVRVPDSAGGAGLLHRDRIDPLRNLAGHLLEGKALLATLGVLGALGLLALIVTVAVSDPE